MLFAALTAKWPLPTKTSLETERSEESKVYLRLLVPLTPFLRASVCSRHGHERQSENRTKQKPFRYEPKFELYVAFSTKRLGLPSPPWSGW